MNLSEIALHLRESAGFSAVRAALPSAGLLRVGVTEGAKAVTVAALAADVTGPVVVVTARPQTAKALVEELTAWAGERVTVVEFPERDLLPYRLAEPDPQLLQQRLQVLERIDASTRMIVVASAMAAAQPTAGGGQRTAEVEVLRTGQRLDPAALFDRLAAWGYEFGPFVEQPGQAARRGGIIDIFPAAADLPVRLELWGNDIVSMRRFDPLTQRSQEPVDAVSIGPALEMVPNRAGIQRLAASLDWSRVRSDLREKLEPALDVLAAGGVPSREALAFFGPLLARATIVDRLPPAALVVLDEPDEVRQMLVELEEQAADLGREMAAAGDLPAGLPLPFLSATEFMERLRALPRRLELSRWTAEDDPAAMRLPFHAAPAFGGRLRALVEEAARGDGRYIFITQQAARLAELLADQDLPSAVVERVTAPLGRITLVHGALPQGWRCADESGPLTLLTDAEIFGFVKQRRALRQTAPGRRTFLGDLTPGDYVVHIEHGIAKFAGLVRRTINGVEREYLELRYAENDRLFVPSDQIDRVSRYVGPSDHVPHLTRLNSGDWSRAKERVRRAVTDLAKELLELYAAREVAPGFAFSPDGGWQMEMEAAFPYVETSDQLAAIHDVKRDMERPRPMDRLICGDVGYGKTEIAVRAAFKAVMDGKQVAVLVPTTVLAQQHEQTFKERLAGFPVRVEVLSRFRTERDQRQVVADLEAGAVDIVIGTHRLLQKDIRFKDLGLVIIDEEQRFGVAHKERLKQMRREVDVLTLSATPIPRTLHLSLGGIRDMSVMDTPPEDRLPVRTYVTESDDRLIREAILREIDRGGQVYFVHNRVHDIMLVYRRLSALVPEARFSVGHGQMDEEELERTMLQFAAGETDVLICTTIIESGLDIPNVNTIIIDQADRLGLAQLYQLRGRVGRGASRAYAYLLYEKNRALSEAAQKRLQTIFEATELGAGFQIALRDLEIRGAGNLLGSEQSGHIGAVGFDLYTRLLADAVERLRAMMKGETPPLPRAEQASFAVDLPLTAYLPERYIADLEQRLSIYQRLSTATAVAEVDDLGAELKDRFGPPPAPVRNLLYLVRLRALGRAAGVQGIASEGEVVIVQLADHVRLNREAVQRQLPDGVRVTANQIRLDRSRHPERWRQMLEALLGRMADFQQAVAAPRPRERLAVR
jgi:transcription-repair coupling factor (superfamily II helicase)